MHTHNVCCMVNDENMIQCTQCHHRFPNIKTWKNASMCMGSMPLNLMQPDVCARIYKSLYKYNMRKIWPLVTESVFKNILILTPQQQEQLLLLLIVATTVTRHLVDFFFPTTGKKGEFEMDWIQNNYETNSSLNAAIAVIFVSFFRYILPRLSTLNTTRD